MLKLSALEFFLRTIPESFLCVFLSYIIYGRDNFIKNNKFDRKILIIASALIFAIITYLVRLLPIGYGINTLISMIGFILITVHIMKISVNLSIISIFISVILMSMCEWINAIILIKVFTINKFDNAYLKFLYNLPSLFMFALIVLMIYIAKNKFIKEFDKDVFN